LNFRGKIIDPLKLWSEYCELKDEQGPFLSLTYCPNPEHLNAHTPAFQINIAQPRVHCFAHCGISGSYEHAVCVIEGIYEKLGISEEDIANNKTPWQLNESLTIRASRTKVRRAYRLARKIIYEKSVARVDSLAGIRKINRVDQQSRTRGVKKAVKKAVDKEKQLATYSYLPKQAIAYLEYRKINEASRHRWQLGFDEEAERITIPIRDERGKLLFIARRGIHKWQRPGYLYSAESEKTKVLFGACALDKAVLDSLGLVLVEGSLDTIIMHQHGFRNTVGTLGNKLSDVQIEIIMRLMQGVSNKRITLFFDKDAGGVTAIENARPLSQKYQIRVALYPKSSENLDPAKLTREQAEKAFRKAVPLLSVMQKLKKARKGAIA
jgi:hypothetical protein